ncbi:MAG: PTS sugar transporter subunit IIC [Clostridiales Family XIII bacterium]|jgi:PTS system galactosamine-specific IIC component|nr:PTS sugar transporter subunit IIC [Clostridiales Family XIII bacterium]
MDITLLQGLMITGWAVIAGCDYQTEAFFIFRPIVVATVTGILLGDPVTGAMVGGLTELAFAGLTMVGGTTPPDPLVAGLMGAVFAICGNMSPTNALALAIPFCILSQYIHILTTTAYLAWNRVGARMIKGNNVKGLVRINVFATLLSGVISGIFIFLSTYVIQDAIDKIIAVIPEWLMHGLEVAGGVMPALGFAMLLMVMFKVRYVPFLIVGFLLACFIEFKNLLPIALVGFAFAVFNYFYGRKDKDVAAAAAEENGGNENVGI